MQDHVLMSQFSISEVASQVGRIALVTGANTGLGYETAKGLASTGMKVVMACRDIEKADEAKAKILKVHPQSDIVVMIVDLSKMQSVREFAGNYLNLYNRLDILVNNAGIMVPPYSKTEDGLESQMAVNYFSHFLLTGQLFKIISNTAGSRIVTLASNAHKKAKINFDDLNWEKGYKPLKAYGQSKLACLIFAFELNRRIKNRNLRTLSVAAHPGLSITELVRHFPKWLLLLGKPITGLITHTPDKGAIPTLYAALGNDVQGGEYFGPQGYAEWTGKPGRAKSFPQSHDLSTAEKLWKLSEQITGVSFP